MAIEEKIQELVTNEEFAEGMFGATTPDELMKVFAEHHVEISGVTKEEAFTKVQQIKSGELLEDDLENISGGVMAPILLVTCVPGIGWAAAGALAIGALATAAYHYYKKRKK